MCGIAGVFLASHKNDRGRIGVVGDMTAALRHRGPDGGGTWTDHDAGISLGHRRLAIIDLSATGRQPMQSHSGRFVLTYNGEVYNFKDLLPQLRSRGHKFLGHSDTEVMLAAFDSFGLEESLKKLAGMFAFALWDREDRILHLARDRLGKKPMYVAACDGAVLFASELKAFRAVPWFEPEIDTQALAAVLRYGWVPDHLCIWKNVFKLPPGTTLSLRACDIHSASTEHLKRGVRTWWSLEEAANLGMERPLDIHDPELATDLDDVLRLAVRERMVADVPLGAFLSGGLDSTTVVALMQAQASSPVRTFTMGFQEASYDETSHAGTIARHLGTDHTELQVAPAEASAVIPELPHVWDEPFADESQIPTLLMTRLARKHVTVALSGDGGDESFGGYLRHTAAARLGGVLAIPVLPRRLALSALQPLMAIAPDRLGKLTRALGAAGESDFYDRLTSVGSGFIPDGDSLFSARSVPPLPDLASRIMFRDTMAYLPGDVLVKMDRASMAVGLEARCPLLDHRVVEFAWRLPLSAKISGGSGKQLLRRVLERYVPRALFNRPKHGFNVPIGTWLKGPLRGWAEELLSGPRLRSDGLLDPAVVRARWQEHLSGRRDHACEIWAILMVQAWLSSVRCSLDLGKPAPITAHTAVALPEPIA